MSNAKGGLAVKRTATGLGLFTLLPIRSGKLIVEYTGRLLIGAEAQNMGGRYLFGFGKGLMIDGSSRSNLARYINHSCKPNAESCYYGRRLWIYAMQAIKSGEAITLDYGKEYFEYFIKPNGCKCEGCSA